MTARVVLVGFEDQDNLGLRYLSSRLRQEGHQTWIATITDEPNTVLEAVRALQPQVVGFSLIFQYLVPQYAALLARLRAEGVRAHFTMGGHYPSFEPAEVLAAVPHLDSVVRFEGEDTLVTLAERIAAEQPWGDVPNMAYRGPTGTILTALTPGRPDLDDLPWPDRDDINYAAQPLPVASVLGSRGCTWRCSFCSIATFYERNGTRGRRRRDPSLVVDELEYLHRERGVRVILWQDDDFLAGGRAGVEWALTIARMTIDRGLHKGLRWKISCRSDEVGRDVFRALIEAGLTHVYLGVEAGDRGDLKHLNKLLMPVSHLRAGAVLRQLGLSFDFGFMLLQPWSTFASVRNNLAFLRRFAGGGASVVSVCRTLPYAGTALKDRLKAEGRLLEGDFNADYRFLEPRLDVLYDWLLDAFAERNFAPFGTVNILRRLLFEAALDRPGRPTNAELLALARGLTALSNQVLLDTVEAAVDHVESLQTVSCDDPTLAALKAHNATQDARLQRDIRILAKRHPDVWEHLPTADHSFVCEE